MKKAIFAIATSAALAIATLTPTTAEAGGRGVAAGLFGFAAGTIFGSAIASSRPAYAYPVYGPPPGYVAYDGYYAARPVACPAGYWARRPIYDRWGNMIGYTRPRFICP